MTEKCSEFCFVILIAILTSTVSLSADEKLPVTALEILDNDKLVVGSDEGLFIYDAATLQPIRQILTGLEKVNSLEVSPDRTKIAVAGGTPAETGVVEVYLLPGFELLRSVDWEDEITTDVAWRSEDLLVAASMKGTCCLISLMEKKPGGQYAVHSKGVLAIEPIDAELVASSGADSALKIWTDSHELKRNLNNHTAAINDLALRPVQGESNLPLIASASDDATVRFWHPTIGRLIRFVRLESIPNCLIWKQDGSLAIAGCRDGTIRLINPDTAKNERTIQSESWVNCLALGNDGHTLFVGGVRGLSKIDLASQR